MAFDEFLAGKWSGDNGTVQLVVAPLAADRRFRTVRDPQVFTAVLRTIPTYSAWLDVMDPITEVFPMAGLHNTLRRLVVDGIPVATGLHAIGDSVCTTNPTLGRGLPLALSGAADLADILGGHAADPAAQALAMDRLAVEHVVPFYQDQAAIDAARLAMMRHAISGAPPPRPAETPGRVSYSQLRSAASWDPGRLPRVLEDQRHGLPSQPGLHRPGRGGVHTGSPPAARRRTAGDPAHPRAARYRPRQLKDPYRSAHPAADQRPHGNDASRTRASEDHRKPVPLPAVCAYPLLVDSLIAVLVTLNSGAGRYFLTWGRLGSNDPWPGDVERAVLKASGRWAIGGTPVAARVCDSLQEASGERYFYEALTSMQRQMPPPAATAKFAAWADAMTVAVLRGEQQYFLGLPRDEQDLPADPDARFGYMLECHDREGHLVTGYHLDGLTPQDVQELLGDDDIDRVMCLAHPVSGPALAAVAAGRDIDVDEAAYGYDLCPWADAGYRTPRGYFPPPPYLPADPGADEVRSSARGAEDGVPES